MVKLAVIGMLALSLVAACGHRQHETKAETETRTHIRTITVEPGPAAEIK
jgi:hypothetical protein